MKKKENAYFKYFQQFVTVYLLFMKFQHFINLSHCEVQGIRQNHIVSLLLVEH